MAKKVNIMAEVDDVVYEAVVVPHKRSKSFSTLVATLIKGYYSNSMVRAYADGTLDEVMAQSNSTLNDIIGSMHESLASMGMMTDELKFNTQEGMDTFSNMQSSEGMQGSDNFSGLGVSMDEIKDAISEETKDLREDMNLVQKQNQEIMDMLRTIMQGGVSVGSSSQSDSESGLGFFHNAVRNANPDKLEERNLHVVETTDTRSDEEKLPEVLEALGGGIIESEKNQLLSALSQSEMIMEDDVTGDVDSSESGVNQTLHVLSNEEESKEDMKESTETQDEKGETSSAEASSIMANLLEGNFYSG